MFLSQEVDTRLHVFGEVVVEWRVWDGDERVDL